MHKFAYYYARNKWKEKSIRKEDFNDKATSKAPDDSDL